MDTASGLTSSAAESSVPDATTPPEPRRALVISALGFTQILAWGSSYYLLTVLAKPIAAGTGWPFTWVVSGLSLGLLVSGLASRRVGRTIERHGGRPVLATSAVLLAIGLFTLALAPDLPIYLAAWLVLGLGMGAGLYEAAFSTLGRLYGLTARGAITSLTLWGGFAATVCWPLSAYLVQVVGWRGTCLVYAVSHLAVVLPLYVFVLPHEEQRSPEPSPHAEVAGASAFACRPSKKALLLGMLAAILMTGGVIFSIWSVHLITILQADGVTLATAVALGALIGPAQVGSRAVEMTIGRYHHPIWTLLASVTLIAMGLALLWTGFPVLSVPLFCYGAGSGIWSIARGTLPLALFGPSGYAELMGRLAMPSLIAQSVAPSLGAVLLESAGTSGTLAVLAGLALLNVALVVALWFCARQLMVSARA
jgi:predicted MFS family arabinose efflux permease